MHGRYIGFVDSDDYIEETMYEKLVSLLITTKADIVACTHDLVGNVSYTPDVCNKAKLYNSEQFMRLYVQNSEKFSPSIWQRIYKREIIKGISFEEGRKNEDILWSAKAIIEANSIAYLDSVLYHYRIRDDSLSDNGLGRRRIVTESTITDQIGAYIQLEILLTEKCKYKYADNLKMVYLPIVFNAYCSIKYYHIGELEPYLLRLDNIWESNRNWIKKNITRFKGRNRIVLLLASMPKIIYVSIWNVRQRLEVILRRIHVIN